MKTKSFDDYAKQRLTKKEINIIKKQAKKEKELFDRRITMDLKDFVTHIVASLPKETKIEFDLSVLPSGCDNKVIVSCSGNNGLSRIKFTLET